MRFVRMSLVVIVTWGVVSPCGAQGLRVSPPGKLLKDSRSQAARTFRDADHPWVAPETLSAWQQVSAALRQRLLVSTGLWPMPERTPLDPVIHGRIEREGYTIEKVYFASRPGHYVTGNLYRPKNRSGKRPAVLSPHGHWQNGRKYDAGEKAAGAQIKEGAEIYPAAARYPLQARMVQLARMGCVVFHYDMVGYASSRKISHRGGFSDVESALFLHGVMGLQTWNSIRALDFLLSLDDVDPQRVGVTGASGGGTQTFILCALDPRPAAAFPAVMVSTAMQGGCVCENANYLRIGCNNISFAALFAPRPLAMSGADDWTKKIETKGLPELKQIYGLLGKQNLVQARTWPQFGHNYNQHSRQFMYAWFNRHLGLGYSEPIKEEDFEPVPAAQLEIFDEDHPLPGDAAGVEDLRGAWRQASRAAFDSLLPTSEAGVEEYRRIVGTAVRVMLGGGGPKAEEVVIEPELKAIKGAVKERLDGVQLMRLMVRRGRAKVPLILLRSVGRELDQVRRVVLWVDGVGKRGLLTAEGHLIPVVQDLLAAGIAVASIDPWGTGEFVGAQQDPVRTDVDRKYVGYTFAYNLPLLAHRVQDVMTALVALPKILAGVESTDLVGTGAAGTWVLLARALAGDAVSRTLVDLEGFSFSKIHRIDDSMLLPGALRYGGIGGLAALTPPGLIVVAGTDGIPEDELLPLRRISALTDGQTVFSSGPLSASMIKRRLLR